MDTTAELCRRLVSNYRTPFGIWLAIHISLKLRLGLEENRWVRRLERLHEQDPSDGPQGRAGRPWGVNERLILAQAKCTRWGPPPDSLIAEGLKRPEEEVSLYWRRNSELCASRNMYDRWYRQVMSLVERSEAIMDKFMRAFIWEGIMLEEEHDDLDTGIWERERSSHHLDNYEQGIRREEENDGVPLGADELAAAGIDFAELD